MPCSHLTEEEKHQPSENATGPLVVNDLINFGDEDTHEMALASAALSPGAVAIELLQNINSKGMEQAGVGTSAAGKTLEGWDLTEQEVRQKADDNFLDQRLKFEDKSEDLGKGLNGGWEEAANSQQTTSVVLVEYDKDSSVLTDDLEGEGRLAFIFVCTVNVLLFTKLERVVFHL